MRPAPNSGRAGGGRLAQGHRRAPLNLSQPALGKPQPAWRAVWRSCSRPGGQCGTCDPSSCLSRCLATGRSAGGSAGAARRRGVITPVRTGECSASSAHCVGRPQARTAASDQRRCRAKIAGRPCARIMSSASERPYSRLVLWSGSLYLAASVPSRKGAWHPLPAAARQRLGRQGVPQPTH